MTKSRLMLMVCFLAAFVAGLALGLAGPKQLVDLVRSFRTTPADSGVTPHPGSGHRPPGPPPLDKVLNLSAEQKQKVDQIWKEAREKADLEWKQREERRKALDEQRKQAILALIPAERHEEYTKVRQDFEDKMNQLMRERPKSFEEAVERTKQVLSEQQLKEYEQWMKQHRPPGPRGRGPGRRGEDRATTRPAFTRPSR